MSVHWMFLGVVMDVETLMEVLSAQQVPTRPETGHQHTWQSYNTKHIYLQDPRQVAVHVTKLQHTACTYALSSIRFITIIVDAVLFILDTTYIGD